MKKLMGLSFMVLFCCQFLVVGQAQAFLVSEIEAIQADARTAVENALVQLEAANETADPELIEFAARLLELAINNYAAITEYLESGDYLNDTDNLLVNSVKSLNIGINNICTSLAAGDLAAARAEMLSLQAAAANLPENTSSELPPGLADLAGVIGAAVATASNFTNQVSPGVGGGQLTNPDASRI